MTTFEIAGVIVVGIIIAGALLVIYVRLRPPAPPPAVAPAAPPPAAPPAPPAPTPVSAKAYPGRFALVFVNPPPVIKGKGRFTLQVAQRGTWLPTEVPDYSNASLDLEVLDGDGQGILSAISEMQFNSTTGKLELVQALYFVKQVGAGGSVTVDVIATSDRSGVDILSAVLSGGAAAPAQSPINIVP